MSIPFHEQFFHPEHAPGDVGQPQELPGGIAHPVAAIRFAVQHGAGLGHTLGVPTINQLYPQGFQMPRSGIYITRTLVNGTWYPSATGLGSRPTVNDDATKVTCETFIPGFSGDLYGTDPVVEFHAYLSPSKKFDTLDELRDCINNAAQRAQEYFK